MGNFVVNGLNSSLEGKTKMILHMFQSRTNLFIYSLLFRVVLFMPFVVVHYCGLLSRLINSSVIAIECTSSPQALVA